jgi:hypothetical protein
MWLVCGLRGTCWAYFKAQLRRFFRPAGFSEFDKRGTGHMSLAFGRDEPSSVLYKKVPSRERLRPMKTTRHTINVPAEMEQLLNDRIRDFRSLSAYFVSLCFTDLLYLPKRPIAKAFANASWQQQRRAIESLAILRKHGWRGINLKLHFDAATQVEKEAQKCLKPDDWLLDHIQEELAFMRGADLRR